MMLQLEALQFYYVGTNETEDVDIDDFYDGVSLYALPSPLADFEK